MSKPQWRERPDRPISEDDRLINLATLVPYYRNLWIESDFHDDPPETVAQYKALYEHYAKLLKEGKHYEPKF
jgi:hypothetical protein